MGDWRKNPTWDDFILSEREIDIFQQALNSPSSEMFGYLTDGLLPCPICSFPFTHQTRNSRWFEGHDNYEAPHKYRGDLFAMEMWSECGCQWWLTLGFHKGSTYLRARIWRGCDERAMKAANNEEKTYTIEQLRGAWGAGYHKGKEDSIQ